MLAKHEGAPSPDDMRAPRWTQLAPGQPVAFRARRAAVAELLAAARVRLPPGGLGGLCGWGGEEPAEPGAVPDTVAVSALRACAGRGRLVDAATLMLSTWPAAARTDIACAGGDADTQPGPGGVRMLLQACGRASARLSVPGWGSGCRLRARKGGRWEAAGDGRRAAWCIVDESPAAKRRRWG